MAGLNVDLNDDHVRNMLGVSPGSGLATGKRELVHVAGDVPAPDGSGDLGVATTWHLNRSAIGHPLVIYKSSILTVDVYSAGEDEPMRVNLICPRCHHSLTIGQDRKRMEFDRVIHAPNPTREDEARIAAQMTTPTTRPNKADLQAFGKLSVEAFECTWEMSAHRAEFGTSLCRWKVVIDENIARDV
jgi:hypothetical protein